MSNKEFSDWNSLVSAVEATIPNILKKDVAPIAEKILRQHIEADIYGTYTPKLGAWVNGSTYQRRHVLENSVSSFIDGDVLTVTSTATASPSVVKGYSFSSEEDGAFLKLLEKGKMGIWKNGFPRPAVSNTQKDFKSNGELRAAIQKGIKREIG